MIRSAMIILQKDARLRLRDRSVWMFALVIPLALTFVFSLVFPDQDDFRLVAGVVDLDGGEVAEGFTDGVLPSLVDEGFLTITSFADQAEARSAIASGDIAAAWVIPEGFTDQVTEGEAAELRLLANPDRALSAEVARGIADGYGARIERASLAVATGMTATQGQLTEAQVQQLSTDAVTSGSSIAIGELVATDRQLAPSSYLAAGMAIFFVFFTVTFGITGFLEEKDQGTLPRLLAAPISPVAIHLGKALGAFVLGVVSMMVLALASDWLLDAPWGPPVGVAILTVAAVIAALGVMAFVGTFARTAEQVGNLQAIVALVLGLTGGVFFPVGSGVLGSLSLLSPHGWFLRGLADLAGERTWTAVLPAAGALVAFGVITAIPGAVRMSRVQRP